MTLSRCLKANPTIESLLNSATHNDVRDVLAMPASHIEILPLFGRHVLILAYDIDPAKIEHAKLEARSQ